MSSLIIMRRTLRQQAAEQRSSLRFRSNFDLSVFQANTALHVDFFPFIQHQSLPGHR